MTKKILLVNFDRGSVPYFLVKKGFEIKHCDRPGKIISILENDIFHAVIIDLALLYGDDSKIIGEIKNNPITKHVGVLIVGSISKDEMIKLIFNSGADDFISTPIAFSELSIRLYKILDMDICFNQEPLKIAKGDLKKIERN